MRKKNVLFLYLLILSGTLFSQSPFSVKIDSLIHKSIDLGIMSQFDSAIRTLDDVTEAHPDHPVGFFYKAATIQSRMMDYEDNQWEDLFFQYIDSTLSKAEKVIETDPDDPWAYFYCGGAWSYLGLYQAKSGQLVAGFRSARKGLSYLRKAVEMDTEIYDAYLALGNYNYYSGKYQRFLNWLPGIRDTRKKGIHMIQKSITDSSFTYWAGINSMGWIEYDRQNYDEAAALFQYGLANYPGSRFFLWGLADTYYKSNNWEKAIPVYREILKSVQSERINNHYNEIICLSRLAVCYSQMGKYEMARSFASIALSCPADADVLDRLSKPIGEARKILRTSQAEIGGAGH